MENYAIIICGGKSTRMGSDKALIEYDGEPMLLHHVRAFLDRSWRVVVTGVDVEKEKILRGMAVEIVPLNAERGKRGPIRGILSGLGVVPDNTWIHLSPCDAPHLIDTILDSSQALGGDLINMPIWSNGDEWFSEPLWSCGSKESFRKAILEGEGPLYIRFRQLGCNEVIITLPYPWISSLNTPVDIERISLME